MSVIASSPVNEMFRPITPAFAGKRAMDTAAGDQVDIQGKTFPAMFPFKLPWEQSFEDWYNQIVILTGFDHEKNKMKNLDYLETVRFFREYAFTPRHLRQPLYQNFAYKQYETPISNVLTALSNPWSPNPHTAWHEYSYRWGHETQCPSIYQLNQAIPLYATVVPRTLLEALERKKLVTITQKRPFIDAKDYQEYQKRFLKRFPHQEPLSKKTLEEMEIAPEFDFRPILHRLANRVRVLDYSINNYGILDFFKGIVDVVVYLPWYSLKAMIDPGLGMDRDVKALLKHLTSTKQLTMRQYWDSAYTFKYDPKFYTLSKSQLAELPYLPFRATRLKMKRLVLKNVPELPDNVNYHGFNVWHHDPKLRKTYAKIAYCLNVRNAMNRRLTAIHPDAKRDYEAFMAEYKNLIEKLDYAPHGMVSPFCHP